VPPARGKELPYRDAARADVNPKNPKSDDSSTSPKTIRMDGLCQQCGCRLRFWGVSGINRSWQNLLVLTGIVTYIYGIIIWSLILTGLA